jgi:hypothetical protein
MATSEERMQILQMLANGIISAEEAAKLLKALEEGSRPKPPPTQPRWFKVRITDLATGKEKVNISIPMSLVNVGVKMGARFAPEMEGINFSELLSSVREGAYGRLVDVTDEQGGERVEIYVE